MNLCFTLHNYLPMFTFTSIINKHARLREPIKGNIFSGYMSQSTLTLLFTCTCT